MFIFLALVAMLFSKGDTLINFSRVQLKIHFCEIILILDPWLRGYWYLKISYLELWSPFCSAERNPLCNFW